MNNSFFRWQDETLILYCHIQPGASRDGIAGLHGERLKIRLQAPATEGKANKHLTKYLAKRFGVSDQDVVIASGISSRQKTIHITRPHKIPDEIDINFRQSSVTL